MVIPFVNWKKFIDLIVLRLAHAAILIKKLHYLQQIGLPYFVFASRYANCSGIQLM